MNLNRLHICHTLADCLFGLVVCLLLSDSAMAQSLAENKAVVSTINIQFQDTRQRIFDGIIELPAADTRNGYAVMMLGGGLVYGLDWEIPPIFSISGKWERDGKTIAKALLKRGFVVMRWRAIYRGDKKFAEDPLMADLPTFPESVEHARLALSKFRSAKVVDPDNIFLLGHSLGARRAAVLLEDNPNLPGFVSLAGANLVRAKQDPLMELVDRAKSEFVTRDENKNGELDAKECADPNLSNLKFPTGLHEFIVQRLSQQPKDWFEPKQTDRFGYRIGSHVIREYRTPTLAIVGTLDRRWLAEHYALCALQRIQPNSKLDVRFFDDLGHQLGKEESQKVVHPKFGVVSDAKLGPIAKEVVDLICRWLADQTQVNHRD